MEHWAAFPAEIEPSSSSNPSSSRQGEVQKSEKDKAYEKFMAEEKKVLSHVNVVNDYPCCHIVTSATFATSDFLPSNF